MILKEHMKIVYGVSVLAGTIIGAGLFSLPYIASVVGIYWMIAYIVVIGAVSLLIHYFFGEVSLKTPDFRRFPGFARYHLGKKAEKVAYVSGVLGLLGAILAYIILGGEFLHTLFSPVVGGNILFYTGVITFLGAYFIYFGIKGISKVQTWGLIFFFVLLLSMLVRGWGSFSLDNLMYVREGAFDLFLPYGALLFALWGASLIPEIEEMLGEEKNKLTLVVFIGVVVSVIVSIFFTFLILGISGDSVTPNALGGLKDSLSNGVVSIALIFGVVATFTSFVAIGLTLKKIFWYDLKIDKRISWAITCFVPFLLFLFGARDFISVIGTVGAVMIAVDATLVCIIYEKIKSKKVRFLTYPLIVAFLFGIIYELIYFIR